MHACFLIPPLLPQFLSQSLPLLIPSFPFPPFPCLITPSLFPLIPPFLPPPLPSPSPLPPSLPLTRLQVATWPGFRFSLNMSGVDQFNRLTTATARFFFTPPPKVLHETMWRNSCNVKKLWIVDFCSEKPFNFYGRVFSLKFQRPYEEGILKQYWVSMHAAINLRHCNVIRK